MNFAEKLLRIALPNNRFDNAKMAFSLGDGDYYSGDDRSKFKSGISATGTPRFYNNQTVRINARNAYEESPTGRAIIRRHVDNTVDTGLKFKSKPLYQIIGISRENAEKWADEFNLRFDLFMRSKFFSSSGTMTGYQMQRHLMLSQFRDGEYFVVINRKRISDRQLSPLSFQVVDAQQVGRDTFFTNGFSALGGSYLMTGGYNDYDFDKGIKRDKYCRELSYLVTFKNIKNGKVGYARREVPAFISNGLPRMIHGFVPEYPNQLRGTSIISPILQELQQILDCNLSHIAKTIAQSQLIVASETDGEEASVDLFQGLNVGQGSMILDQEADSIISSTESQSSSGEAFSYTQVPEAQIQVPGSVGFFNLPPGNKVKMLSNSAPATGYGEFMEYFVSDIAPACDMSAEVLKMKFGSNYNANRATLTLAWRIARAYRKELESDFLDIVTESFLESEIAAGRMRAPGFSDPIMRSAWLNGEWIGSPMPEMDPVKTMKSQKGYIEMGATTLDRVAIEINGSDGRINRSENERQIAELTRPPWVKEDTGSASGADTSEQEYGSSE